MLVHRPTRVQVFAICAFIGVFAAACQDHDRGEPGNLISPSKVEPEQGRWTETSRGVSDGEEQGLIEQLMSIGYLRGSRGAANSGVTIHDTAQAHRGFNLYTSGHAPEAVLMDMEGGVLHRWRLPYVSAFTPLAKPNSNAEWWRRVAIFENGDLLAIYEGLGLVKLDKHSRLIWANSLDAHHDLEVQANGDIYVLTRKAHRIPRIDRTAPVLEDFISVLTRDGKLKAEMSLLECFEGSRFANLVDNERISGNGDIFHTNTVAVLDGRFANRDPAFAQGNVLTSMNRMGVVAVVSVRLGQVVWVRRTAPVGQHDPKLLANGNMLLFTNNMNDMNDDDTSSGSSNVEEFDPRTGEVQWSYRGTEEHPFYSKYLGTAERLRNGNTLITESDGGRAFEVTRTGETVWEFYNPNRAGSNGEFIATLPELIRLPASYPIGWASGPSPPTP